MNRILLFVLLSSSAQMLQAQIWKLDPMHSSVKFTVVHLSVSEVEGKFSRFDGSMQSANPDFTDGQITFKVEVGSINSDSETRDNHLKSDDFLNAAEYPTMTFRSTSFKKLSEKKYSLEGDLTIRDVTRPVTFDVKYGGTVVDSRGATRAGFVAVTVIDRFDYNLKWNKMVEATAVVGSEVAVKVNAEFIRLKE